MLNVWVIPKGANQNEYMADNKASFVMTKETYQEIKDKFPKYKLVGKTVN